MLQSEKSESLQDSTPVDGAHRRWWQSEWAANAIAIAAFLPLTLPNCWEGKWRHSLFQLALWLAVFGRRRWSVLLLIPFYLATPILLFVSRHYGPPNLDLLAAVRGSVTLSSVRIAFLKMIPGSYYCLYSLIVIPVLAFFLLRHSARRRAAAKFRWACLLVAAAFFSSWCLDAYRLQWHGETQFREVVVRHLGSYQPLGLPLSWLLTELDADGGQQAAVQRAQFKYEASCSNKIDDVIFVIGESARADHWHLNGYDRPTTPKLDQIPNLISFSNLMSLSPNTVLSWPFMFTPKAVGDSAHWPNQKTFITAFKEAGYRTYFVSFCMDQHSTRNDPLAIITLEADTVINALTNSAIKTWDTEMLPAIRQTFAAKGPKLVVISTQGSHTGFESKLPPEYEFFQPSELNGHGTAEQCLNAYDNTIRMTDDFLAAVIAQLEARHSRAVLLYVSDHGLACCDKGETFLGQAFIKPEYHPACVVWASQAFLADASGRSRFQLGRQHAAAPVTMDYILHSILDLGGIQTKILDPSKSLFSADLVAPVKWRVEDFQGRWLNYNQVPDTVK
jgi:glucan phosphoethanolaminetransferase (alkaline phosphatase superfamily)